MKKKSNLLFVVRSLNIGGAQRQLVVLAKALSQRGYKIEVAVFYTGGPLEAELKEAGIVIHLLRKSGRWELKKPIQALAAIIEQGAFDVVHGYLPTANIVAAAACFIARPRPKLIFGVRASNMERGNYGFVSRAAYLAEAWLSRLTDLVISNSSAGLRSIWQRRMSEGRGLVIPNGINTDRFRPRARGLVRGNCFRIGMIARADPMKDHNCFFAAAEIVSRKRSDVVFVLAGEGTADLKEKSLGLPMEIHDLVLRPEELLAGLDIAVLSSSFGEGFPNAVAEAMACGVPVAATNVGDIPTIIGNFGRIVPTNNPSALADAILDLIISAREERLRTDCRRHIEEHFSVPLLAQRTDDAISALVNR